ncbi:hypothetical protein FHT13_001825 [Xanthomonas arboricola]|nr:hypothetical protein [Xanthomonas arboricola]
MAQGVRGFEYVGGNDLFQQALKLGSGQGDPVQLFEMFAEISFERSTATNVRSQRVLEPTKLFDKFLLDGGFSDAHMKPQSRMVAAPSKHSASKWWTILPDAVPGRLPQTPMERAIADGLKLDSDSPERRRKLRNAAVRTLNASYITHFFTSIASGYSATRWQFYGHRNLPDH